MQDDSQIIYKKILVFILVFCVLSAVSATYYRYVVKGEFDYETKPVSEFTEEDF